MGVGTSHPSRKHFERENAHETNNGTSHRPTRGVNERQQAKLEKLEQQQNVDKRADVEVRLPVLFSADNKVVCHPQLDFKKSFYLSRDIGEGSFGVVMQAIHKATKQVFAIKIMEIPGLSLSSSHPDGPILLGNLIEHAKQYSPGQTARLDMLHREIQLQAHVKSENVLPLKCIFYFFEGQYLSIAIVLPLCRAGTLELYLRRTAMQHPITLTEAKVLLRGILRGLARLHSEGIVHRDIKPENILLHYPSGESHHQGGVSAREIEARGCPSRPGADLRRNFRILPTPLIADFGLAREISKSNLRTFCGTVDYLPPELIASRHLQGGIREVLAGTCGNPQLLRVVTLFPFKFHISTLKAQSEVSIQTRKPEK
uniref:Protein kinase domain-containing protein n=1 Tax=Palpitomonas bilix TaxID=652834 RepID=A0A7S3DFH5_9EUKA